jgi:putative transposase
MPYRSDIFAQGEYYHIYNRGVNKRRIFFSTKNYLYCLRLLKKYSGKYHITIIAYCLMPNHYHLVLRQDSDISISKYINVIFSAYVQAVNRRLQRRGPLFESRFKTVHINKDEYILHLCRYIHLNPVKAKLVKKPEHWSFSNFLEWINQRDGLLKDTDFISTYFSSPQEYQKFVTEFQLEADLKKKLEPLLLD